MFLSKLDPVPALVWSIRRYGVMRLLRFSRFIVYHELALHPAN